MDPSPDILNSIADLVGIAGKLPPSNVVVPGGHRLEDLKLVEAARDHGIVDRIILVGDRRAITRSIDQLGIRIRPDRIVSASDSEATAAATARLVAEGRADIVLKGDISTPVINRALRPLAVRPTVSLATVFDAAPFSGGRPMVLTDAGFTTVCNFGRMVDLVNNACEVARLVLGIPRPRVAILSANEKPIPSLPSTWLGKKLSEREWKDAVVYGPLSFDLATDPESVALKGIASPSGAREVAGRADVLVSPGIDTANALYKAVTALNKFGLASLAGITVGFPFPYVILSRADTLETRLESIALCSVFFQRGRSARLRSRRPRRSSSSSRILAIHPGPGSIKVAVFTGGEIRQLGAGEIESPPAFPAGGEQPVEKLAKEIRRIVRSWSIRRIDAVAVPAGFLPPPEPGPSDGIYRIASRRGEKVSLDREISRAAQKRSGSGRLENLGIVLGAALARLYRVPAWAVDPCANENSISIEFALRAAARLAAVGMRRPDPKVKLVAAYLGPRIATTVFRGGEIGGITFWPEAGKKTSLSLDRISREIAIDRAARQIAGEVIAAGGDIESIVLAGETGRGREILGEVRRRISRLAPVVVQKGEVELEGLAVAAAGALSGKIRPLRYRSALRRKK